VRHLPRPAGRCATAAKSAVDNSDDAGGAQPAEARENAPAAVLAGFAEPRLYVIGEEEVTGVPKR
jgi:hypothetical protein